MTFRLWRCFNQRHFYLPFYVSCLSRAFVQKQLISMLKTWAGRLIWRRRNIVLPVSSVTAVTDSTPATSALAKKSSHPLQLGNADAKKVEFAPHIKSAVIPSASTSAHVNTGGTFCAELGGRFGAYAGVNAHNIKSHSHLFELDDCASESNNCNHMKTLAKVTE